MSATAKLERAQHHLNQLRKSIDEYHQSMPFELFVKDEAGDLIYRIKILKPVPAQEWSLIVGDIVHNLHSALDLRISELTTNNGNTPTRDNAFPFASNANDIQNEYQKRLAGIAEKFVSIITNLKPYKGGNDLLWELHNLDIIDKHRKLIIAGSAQQSVVVDLSAQLRNLQPDLEIPSMRIALLPAQRDFPLIDGAELFRIKKPARNVGIKEQVNFPFEVAFSDGTNTYGEPLIPKLEKFVMEVKNTLNALI